MRVWVATRVTDLLDITWMAGWTCGGRGIGFTEWSGGGLVLAGGKGRMWERVVCGSWCVRGCVAPPLVTVKVCTLPETSEGGVGDRRRGVWAVAVAVSGVGVVAGGW